MNRCVVFATLAMAAAMASGVASSHLKTKFPISRSADSRVSAWAPSSHAIVSIRVLKGRLPTNKAGVYPFF